MPESFERGALTEATYLILLSLYEPRHGYGVMQHIAALTMGRVNLGPGTLYGAINLLLEKGWIEAYSGTGRKKEYRITQAGKTVMGDEMMRLAELLQIGREIMEKTN